MQTFQIFFSSCSRSIVVRRRTVVGLTRLALADIRKRMATSFPAPEKVGQERQEQLRLVPRRFCEGVALVAH